MARAAIGLYCSATAFFPHFPKEERMLENSQYMTMAREQLKGKWKNAVLITLLYLIISLVAAALPKVGGLISLVIAGPIMLGYYTFFLGITRNENPKIELLFHYFSRFGQAFVTYILMGLFIFLWTLLLIVPGIIAAIGYSQTFFILSEDENIRGMEALRKSKNMMMGYKWKFCYLGLRFIGWALLGVLSAGIGFLWIGPYITTSFANFYTDLKNKDSASAQVSPYAAQPR
jgi:uncharacterized membrane protein